MISDSAKIRNILFKDLQPYINCIADPMVVKDIQHRWVMVNDAFCSFTGYPKEKLLGKTDHDFFPLNQADWFHASDREVFASGAEVGSEEVITDASGVTHTIYTKKRLFVDQDKEKFVVCIIFDITERKKWEKKVSEHNLELEKRVEERTAELALANKQLKEDIHYRKNVEKALRLSESRLEALLKLNQQRFDSEHDMIMFAVEEAVKLTESRVGYVAFVDEESGTIELYEGTGPDYLSSITTAYKKKMEINNAGLWGDACRSKKAIFCNECEDNPFMVDFSRTFVKISRHMHVPILDDGKVVIMAGVANKEHFYDESDARQLTLLMDGLWKNLQKRRAEEALYREKELLSITMRSIGEGMISTDTEGNIVLFNETAEKLTGYVAPEAIGKPVSEIYCIRDERNKTSLSESVYEVLAGEEDASVEFPAVLVSRTGREYIVNHSIAKIRDSEGIVLGAVVIFMDITEKRKIEERLTNTEKLKS
ncbi:MAG: PAS domain S-box protein, partial [Fibrobacterota bacterium]